MLIPENSFNMIVRTEKDVKAFLEYVQILNDSGKLRLELKKSTQHMLTFKIKFSSEVSYKTLEQWYMDNDFNTLLKNIIIDTSKYDYIDEDSEVGFKVELDTKSLWDGDLIHITKDYWICGK